MTTETRISPLFFTMLVLISILGLLASDLYLPSLPYIARDFHVSASMVQLTVGIYFVAFGFFQLILGPLSDKYGRKKILNISMLAFFVSTIVVMLSPTFTVLLIARFIQGAFASASIVLVGPIISDKFEKTYASRLISLVYPFVAASPALAPFIGGFVAEYFGWRAVFVVVLITVALVMSLSFFLLKETDVSRRAKTIHPSHILKQYKHLLTNANFICYLMIAVSTTIIWMTYLVMSPFLLHRLGYGKVDVGLTFALFGFSYMFSGMLFRKLFQKATESIQLYVGLAFLMVGSLGMFMLQRQALHNAWFFMVPMMFLTSANGLVFPLILGRAITMCEGFAGYASALLNSSRIIAAGLAMYLVGKLLGNTVSTLAMVELIFSLIVCIGVLKALYHGGRKVSVSTGMAKANCLQK
jgi:MFS transporter, DHA1 family, multidrug resistance protein